MTKLPSRIGSVAALIALFGSGCAGSKQSSASVASLSGLSATVIPEVGGRSVVELSWQADQQLSSYTLEAGLQSGNYTFPKIDFSGPATSYRWTGVPLGNLYVRLRARGSTGEATSEEILVGSVDPRDVIDALLLGTGRLAVGDNQGCPRPPYMAGWRPGSQLAIRASTGVRQSRRTAAESVAPQVSVATAGNVTAFVAPTGEPNPTPALGEVTLADLPNAEMRAFCACTTCVGCARSFFSGGFTTRAQIVMGDSANDSTPPHEIGHAIGLCHIIFAAGFTPPPTMGVTLTSNGELVSPRGRLSQLDPAAVKAMETAYLAGLVAGASRGNFVSRGLVPQEPSTALPAGTSTLSGAQASPWPAGWRVEITGPDEYVVTKPICNEGVK